MADFSHAPFSVSGTLKALLISITFLANANGKAMASISASSATTLSFQTSFNIPSGLGPVATAPNTGAPISSSSAAPFPFLNSSSLILSAGASGASGLVFSSSGFLSPSLTGIFLTEKTLTDTVTVSSISSSFSLSSYPPTTVTFTGNFPSASSSETGSGSSTPFGPFSNSTSSRILQSTTSYSVSSSMLGASIFSTSGAASPANITLSSSASVVQSSNIASINNTTFDTNIVTLTRVSQITKASSLPATSDLSVSFRSTVSTTLSPVFTNSTSFAISTSGTISTNSTTQITKTFLGTSSTTAMSKNSTISSKIQASPLTLVPMSSQLSSFINSTTFLLSRQTGSSSVIIFSTISIVQSSSNAVLNVTLYTSTNQVPPQSSPTSKEIDTASTQSHHYSNSTTASIRVVTTPCDPATVTEPVITVTEVKSISSTMSRSKGLSQSIVSSSHSIPTSQPTTPTFTTLQRNTASISSGTNSKTISSSERSTLSATTQSTITPPIPPHTTKTHHHHASAVTLTEGRPCPTPEPGEIIVYIVETIYFEVCDCVYQTTAVYYTEAITITYIELPPWETFSPPTIPMTTAETWCPNCGPTGQPWIITLAVPWAVATPAIVGGAYGHGGSGHGGDGYGGQGGNGFGGSGYGEGYGGGNSDIHGGEGIGGNGYGGEGSDSYEGEGVGGDEFINVEAIGGDGYGGNGYGGEGGKGIGGAGYGGDGDSENREGSSIVHSLPAITSDSLSYFSLATPPPIPYTAVTPSSIQTSTSAEAFSVTTYVFRSTYSGVSETANTSLVYNTFTGSAQVTQTTDPAFRASQIDNQSQDQDQSQTQSEDIVEDPTTTSSGELGDNAGDDGTSENSDEPGVLAQDGVASANVEPISISSANGNNGLSGGNAAIDAATATTVPGAYSTDRVSPVIFAGGSMAASTNVWTTFAAPLIACLTVFLLEL